MRILRYNCPSSGFASYGKQIEGTPADLGEFELSVRLPRSPHSGALVASAGRTPWKLIRQPPGERGHPPNSLGAVPRIPALAVLVQAPLWVEVLVTDVERLLEGVRELVRRDLHPVQQRLGVFGIGNLFNDGRLTEKGWSAGFCWRCS